MTTQGLIFDKKLCEHCNKAFSKFTFHRHEATCKMHPDRATYCVVCGTKTPNASTVCSRSCSNTHFRSGPNHSSWNKANYRTICFYFHKKECVVCGEANIVEVHHLDENRQNNDPKNLIPLCPTHHQYWHSRFKEQVEETIMNYVNNFIPQAKYGRIQAR